MGDKPVKISIMAVFEWILVLAIVLSILKFVPFAIDDKSKLAFNTCRQDHSIVRCFITVDIEYYY